MNIDPSTLPAAPAEFDPLPPVAPDTHVLAWLALRRSTKVAHLAEPGPSAAELDAILRIGSRVPDHGKLGPWRFIILSGTARGAYGAALADLLAKRSPGIDADRLAGEAARFERAPCVVAVVFSPVDSPKVPEWEQVLSAGAVCHNVQLAARGFGYAGCWLTEWMTFDTEACALLGLQDREKIAGFLYIGSSAMPAEERGRPEARTRTTYWAPPVTPA